MTNEQHIENLKKLKSFHNGSFGADIDRAIKAIEQESKTGRWSRKTKVDAYDIAGVKTWGIKCQCDRCDFTTIVVEDFGYYKFCPNCGAKMVDLQERSDKCSKCEYRINPDYTKCKECGAERSDKEC